MHAHTAKLTVTGACMQADIHKDTAHTHAHTHAL